MSDLSWVDVEGAALATEFDVHAGANGAPLVFLHAGVADRRMWEPQRAAFAARHPVLRYDRRGFGETRVARAVPYAMVDDLWAAVDAHRVERAVLVGCSQGGRVALDAALARPERVKGLVLVAPAVGGAPDAVLDARVQALSDAIDVASDADDADTVNELEAQLWLDGPWSDVGRVQGAARELFLSMNGIALRATDPGPAVEQPPAWARLGELRVPTLVIWGDLDLPHLQERCEQLVQRIPGAQRAVLAGTAHLPGLEAPEPFNAALRRYLDTL